MLAGKITIFSVCEYNIQGEGFQDIKSTSREQVSANMFHDLLCLLDLQQSPVFWTKVFNESYCERALRMRVEP